MKYRHDLPLISFDVFGRAPSARKPSSLLEPIGSIVGTVLLFAGIVLFIALCHFAGTAS